MEIHTEVTEDKQGRGWCEKLFLTLFGLAFVTAGCFFTYKIFNEVFENAHTRAWTKTECEVISSAVEKNNDRYYFDVLYQYHFRSREFEGKEYSLNYKGSDDYGEAQRLTFLYPPGSVTLCYVNQKSPGRAVLIHEPLWKGLFAFFPLIFVAVGVCDGFCLVP